MKLKTYTDGGSRGNPGQAAIGVLICDDKNEIILEHAEAIGEATNNVAEYRALIEGLKRAKEAGADEVDCFMDSQLVAKQLSGEYKLKNYNMQKLFDEVRKVECQFRKVSYTHVPRENEQICRADQLVNFALDESSKKARR